MMKRILSVVFAALWLGCALSGCRGKDEQTHDASPCGLYTQGKNRKLADTGDGYYYAADHWLWFFDRKTETAVVVCSKPDCLHNEEPDSRKQPLCNAYFDYYAYGTPAVFYDEGALYVVYTQKDFVRDSYEVKVLRVEPDGSQRVECASVPAYGAQTQLPDTAAINDSVFYYAYDYYDEETEGETGIIRTRLDGRGTCETLYRSEEGIYITHLLSSGDFLYFQEYVAGTGRYRQMALDCTSGDCRDLSEMFGAKSMAAAPCRDGLVVAVVDPEQTQPPYDVTLYRAAADGSDAQILLAADKNPMESGGLVYTDGQYIYIQYSKTAAGDGQRAEKQLLLVDFSGTVQADISLTENVPGFARLYVTGGDEILLEIRETEDGTERVRFATVPKSDLTKGRISL